MPETSSPLRILSRLSAVPAFCDLIFRGARASLYRRAGARLRPPCGGRSDAGEGGSRSLRGDRKDRRRKRGYAGQEQNFTGNRADRLDK